MLLFLSMLSSAIADKPLIHYLVDSLLNYAGPYPT